MKNNIKYLIINNEYPTSNMVKILEEVTNQNPQPPYLLSFREQKNQGDLSKRSRLTLDEFASREYLPYIHENLNSWQTSEHILLRQISPVFGNRWLCEIKRMEVHAWQQNIFKDCARHEIRTEGNA